MFSLHVYPEDDIKTLDDWKSRFHAGPIEDEYGVVVSVAEMLRIIEDRGRDEILHSARLLSQKVLDENHAVLGPRSLFRHKLSDFCVGYGEGTWDYLVGEFS